jgi:hypothetical protein
MHGLVLALLLLAATVDPRFDEPLRLLAELQAPDPGGQPIGPAYASLPETLGLTLSIARLPPRAGGVYYPSSRTVMMAEALVGEDPRVMAAGLVHELTHARDVDLIADGQLEPDCVELEARAFEAQAIVTRAFWPDELPTGTLWERALATITTTYESGGLDGLRAWVRHNVGYRRECRSAPVG